MFNVRRIDRDRLGALLAAVVVHLIVAYALLAEFGVVPAALPSMPSLVVADLRPPPPPEPLRPDIRKSVKRAGRASPANIRSRATQIVVPPVPVLVPPPPQVVTTLVRGTGADPSSGNAAERGPGSGSGGVGNGTGSGGAGEGDGDGGELPPRLVRGRIKNSDYPKGAGASGASGTVTVQFIVRPDGRVGRCIVTVSSGNDELDATTCRLIQERFRYAPSRDARGRPVEAEMIENHEWVYQRDDEDH